MNEIAKVLEPLIANELFVGDLRELIVRHGGDVATLDAGILRAEQLEGHGSMGLIVVDRRVYCAGRVVDLSRRPRTLAVFRAFCRSANGFLSCDELVERLYGVKIGAQHSRRMVQSHHNNAIKMISRARIEAMMHLGSTRDVGVEWFVYDATLKGWHLHRWHPYYRQAAMFDRLTPEPTRDA